MRTFALNLVTCETRGKKLSAKTRNLVAFQACDKLNVQLAALTGKAGSRALLSRALALAAMEVHWLGEVQLAADGSLQGLAEFETQLGEKKMTEGGVVLLAQLLGLLVAFIGEAVTWRMLQDIWPQLPPPR